MSSVEIQISLDLAKYLESVGVSDPSMIAKATRIVQDCAFEAQRLDSDHLSLPKVRQCAAENDLAIGSNFFLTLCLNFAPRHYKTLVGFVDRYEKAKEAAWRETLSLEGWIQEQIDAESSIYALGGDEDGLDFVVIAYPDKVEVRAFTQGVGDLIPRLNRRYVGSAGNIRWHYPLSALSALKTLRRLVIDTANYPGKTL